MGVLTASIAAMSAFNTVAKFAGAIGDAMRAESPGEFVEKLLRMGGNTTEELQASLRDMEARIIEAIEEQTEELMDYQLSIDLAGFRATAETVLKTIDDGDVNGADSKLMAQTLMSDLRQRLPVELANDPSPADVVNLTGTLSMAMAARIAAVQQFEYGAFGKDSVREDLDWALGQLEAMHGHMRESFDVEVAPTRWVSTKYYGPWESEFYSKAYDQYFHQRYTVDADNADVNWMMSLDTMSIYAGSNGWLDFRSGLPKDLTFTSGGWNFEPHNNTYGYEPDDVWEHGYRQTLTDWKGREHRIDVFDTEATVEFLQTEIENAVFLMGGTNPDGEDMRKALVEFDVIQDAVEVEGTGSADILTSLYVQKPGSGEILVRTDSGVYGNDYLDGKAGDDLLQGGIGSDVLVGGTGNDTLVGGTDGGEVMIGGEGRDVFVFNGHEGTHRIVDFESGTDKIYLSDEDFAALGHSVTADEIHHGPAHTAGDAKLILDGDNLYFVTDDPESREVPFLTFDDGLAEISPEDFVIYDESGVYQGWADYAYTPVEAPEPAPEPLTGPMLPSRDFSDLFARPFDRQASSFDDLDHLAA